MTLLYEGPYGNERVEIYVCYNLLCRSAWLVPPCLCWPSRPHAALSAFFTQYIPPRVVVTRVDGPNSPAPLPLLCSNFDVQFLFSNRWSWFKRSWCRIVLFIFFRIAILEKAIFSESFALSEHKNLIDYSTLLEVNSFGKISFSCHIY